MPNPIDSLYIDGVLYDIEPSSQAYSGRLLASVGAIECSQLCYGVCQPYQMFKHLIHINAVAGEVGRDQWFDLGFTIFSTRSSAYRDVPEIVDVLNYYAYQGYPWPMTSYKDDIYLYSKRDVKFAIPCTGQVGYSSQRWQAVMIGNTLSYNGQYPNFGIYGIPFVPDALYGDNSMADWLQVLIPGNKCHIHDDVVA